MTYNPNWHGFAQQSNFVEVPLSGSGGYPSEATTPGGLTAKKFAQVMWNISPTTPSIPSNTPANSLTIIEVYIDGTTSYICEALMGSALADSAWRISRSSLNGSGGAVIRWANNGAINLAATDLATVQAFTYS